MKQSFSITFIALFVSLAFGSANASSEDDAYYLAMEKLAASTDSYAQPPAGTQLADAEAGLEEIHHISPTAYITYEKLRPSHQEQVRNTIRDGDDLYNVIELIFSLNK
jgi:hypothetical protein